MPTPSDRDLFLQRLTDPRAVPILARNAIPVIGVFVFGWSVLEAIAALFLDALSTLWVVGAVASYFGAKQFDYGETGVLDALHFSAGVLGIFLFVAGILTFALAVPMFMLLPVVLSADVDPWTLVTSGWLPRAFGLMVACQIPSFAQRIRVAQASGLPPEKLGLDGEIGFLLHRSIVLTAVGSSLAVFGAYGLPLLVIVAQTISAATEIMRDRYIGYLTASRHAPADAGAPPMTRAARLRRWRKRKRR